MSTPVEITITLTNKKGLHARAAAKFVKCMGQFDAKAVVAKVAGAGVAAGAPPASSSGGSILGLMMLGAEFGSTLRVAFDGPQADAAAAAVRQLLEDRFGEE